MFYPLLAFLGLLFGSTAFASHLFIGSIVSNNENSSIAVFTVTGEDGVIYLKVGEGVGGWTVQKVDYGVVTMKGSRATLLLRPNDILEEEAAALLPKDRPMSKQEIMLKLSQVFPNIRYASVLETADSSHQ